MVPQILQDIAFYVGFITDLLVLIIILVILFTVVAIYRKVTQALNSAGRILENTEEIVNTVSENIVRPAAAGSGVAFGVGKIFAFLRGTKKQ
ncbi:MAG: hypothetical protein F4Y44_10065 [Chloroflexi bacterium]|nr:hypothetical protein [Chloroflexota bacterium]